ncbi:hormone-sensitive lipase-like [Mercenaria mercenaria]|uniref:hormone-sensitive lipase-like n=1 Tax=Mercenaria mercenaria TaxID=6596 RepID=UPI00234ECF88|nr:hormone-sensitive lipase-like [Mercenaria mercenaria]
MLSFKRSRKIPAHYKKEEEEEGPIFLLWGRIVALVMADKETEIPFGLCKNDADFLKYFHTSIKDLRGLVISNIEYYQRGKSSIHACYYASSCILLERTQVLEPLVIDIVPKLQKYDFSETEQANGYRSFISIVNRCCGHLLQLCRHINVNKSSLLFRSSHYLKELESYVEVLGQLMACLGYLQKLMTYSKDGDLFLENDESVGDDLLMEVEMLNTDCFYGRCLGFQFSESMQKVLQMVVIAMATFSECYEETSQVIQIASSLFNSGKYFADYDLRAKQVVDITRTADIKFCKQFWSITDSPLLHQLRSFTFPHVEVSEVLSLEPENFELPAVEGEDDTVTITPPCAHTGPAPVKVRLISHAVREGMQVTRKMFQPKTGSAKPAILPPSPGLLFHCHGGGFVAQSSQSHENYLRVWARKLEMPILSVDYALAPDLPFPRGLEESFYAYAWALKNPEKLGWTGERICFAGDSAGGNIVISTALRAVSYQIRIPDGIMAAYVPILVQYTPSPARLLSMIDPLLPVGILTRCLAAYAGIADKFASAIAAPIFCNPGKFENWEVVDSCSCTDDTLDSTVVVSVNQKPDINHNGEKSSNHNTDNNDVNLKANDNPSLELCSDCHGKNVSECLLCKQTTKPKVFQSNDSSDSNPSQGKENLPVCKSLENLSECEFVICDKEKLESDTENYIGECTVISGLNQCDNLSEMDRKIEDSNEMKGDFEVVMENDKPEIEGTNQTTNVLLKEDDVRSEKDFEERNTVGSTINDILDEIDSNLAIDVQVAKSKVQPEHGYGLQENNVVEKTIKDVLDEIDSNVKIDVLTGKPEKVPEKQESKDPSEMYAVCQELLDVGNETGPTNLDDMRSFLCHSLEDLLEDDETVSKEFSEGHSEDKENVSVPNSIGNRCPKQHSVSDTSDSGIHGDTDNESCHDNQSITSSTSKGEPKQMYTRNMSLDLATSFHPGQTSAKSSPHKSLGSPVSPHLSPGKRTFTPKLYSVQRKIAQSPIQLFRHLPIVKNMYMSPLLAPDEALRRLPPVHLTACHFDPLLDDSVMFAKKLSKLGRSVSLKVFDNLPHGFLSFSDASVEARQASNFCCDKIKEVLENTTKF